MDNLLVSIIVPIYNVEKYIEKCVLSLMNQKHKKIEIILVDDGSPDSSGNIIDRLALFPYCFYFICLWQEHLQEHMNFSFKYLNSIFIR